MSKADEMFEKLGYKKESLEDEETEAYIEDVEPSAFRTEIYFHKDKWLIGIHTNINMQELQAINLKCKELGWIE